MMRARARIGDRLQFDGKRTSWLARAETANGRYSIATAWFGCHPRTGERRVAYTIIDWIADIRGPLNVIGGGMGIDTLDGPDPNIDETIEMLEEGIKFEADAVADGAIPSGQWGISYRNRVALEITKRRAAPCS